MSTMRLREAAHFLLMFYPELAFYSYEVIDGGEVIHTGKMREFETETYRNETIGFLEWRVEETFNPKIMVVRFTKRED